MRHRWAGTLENIRQMSLAGQAWGSNPEPLREKTYGFRSLRSRDDSLHIPFTIAAILNICAVSPLLLRTC